MDKIRHTSEWKPFSELRPVQQNISSLGCNKEYIEKHKLSETKIFHRSNSITGVMNYFEPLEAVTMYENYRNNDHTRLEYAGRFKNAAGYVVIASGSREVDCKEDKREFQDITILFQIDENGNCVNSSEWNMSISSSNSMAAVGDYAYFGQNKMVTRLNVLTGETAFFTDKSDEEIDALVKMW